MKVESKLPENDFLLGKPISKRWQLIPAKMVVILSWILFKGHGPVGRNLLRTGNRDKLTFQVFHVVSFLLWVLILPVMVMQLSLDKILRPSTEHLRLGLHHSDSCWIAECILYFLLIPLVIEIYSEWRKTRNWKAKKEHDIRKTPWIKCKLILRCFEIIDRQQIEIFMSGMLSPYRLRCYLAEFIVVVQYNYVYETRWNISLGSHIMFNHPLECYISCSLIIACANIFAYHNLCMFAAFIIDG